MPVQIKHLKKSAHHIMLSAFLFFPGLILAQNEDAKNLQTRLENTDAFLKIKNGVYKGRYSVISGKKIAVSDVILYAKGNSRAYYFFSKSHGHYATLLISEKCYFFDLLRKRKILIEGIMRKEKAGDIGFPPALLFSSGLEKNYEPEKSVTLSTGNMRIFMKGLMPESYARLSVELDDRRPVLMDIYDDNLVLYKTLRYEYRNELQTPDGKPIDEKDFPDHMELLDLKNRFIYRITFHEFNTLKFDDRFFSDIIENRGIFHAPKADNSSFSR